MYNRLTLCFCRLEALRKDGAQGRAKVAVISRRLAVIAREMDGVEGSEKVSFVFSSLDSYAC
jgi:hypothetical protein